jgi:chloramphenicol-sensitive protein RarD
MDPALSLQSLPLTVPSEHTSVTASPGASAEGSGEALSVACPGPSAEALLSPADTMRRDHADAAARARRGLAFGLGAFGWWAVVVPVYFRVLSAHGAIPYEILAQRVVFGLPVLFALLAWRRQLGALVRAATDRRTLRFLLPSTVLIGINWFFFIRSVADGNLSHASLGYYINPLVSVALGFLFLKERLRAAQWAAVGIACVAVAVLAWAEGSLPYISILLPVSFGLYGLLRKQASVGPTVGLTFEMLMLLPLCIALVVWLHNTDRGVFLEGPAWVSGLMLLGGVVTIVPLLCFTAAARLLPLSTVGLLQYLAPTGQLLLAFAFFGETFVPEKWVAFGLIWAAIAVFTTDALRHNARERRGRRAMLDAAGA